MGLVAKESGSKDNFTPVPPGTHLARCYRVIDLGTQKSVGSWGEKLQQKVMIQFEVHSEDEDGNPLVTAKGEPLSISKNYTVSLGENATLRKDLSSWRGRDFTPQELRGFELKNILGHWAMLSVSKDLGNNGKEYTNIRTISAVPAAMKKAGLPEGFNKPVLFSIAEADMEMFETFSKSIKEKIQASPEWTSFFGKQYAKEQAASSHDDLDDIPF
jgi:hypothetical protein